jgi:uncharacterized protein (DUF58 family)
MHWLPTRRLLLLALGVALPLAAATLSPVFFALALLYLLVVIVALVADARRMPRTADFVVTREHDQRLSIGEPNPVDLSIHWARWARSTGRSAIVEELPLAVRDETPVGIPSEGERSDASIRPGETWTGRYHLTPVRRGEYQFGRVVFRLASPLGLLRRQYAATIDVPARVYPNIRAVRRYELLVRQGRLHEEGLRRTRRFGSGTEFERLREYLPDDDFRRINWKATARRHAPVTVEYETERSQNLVLMLDSGRLMGNPIGPLLKLDYCVNGALMLAYVAMEMGDRVGLVVFDDRVEAFVPIDRGERQFQLLLENLYRIRAEPIEADPARALAYLARRQLKRSLIVLFTDLAEAADPRELIAWLGQLARRHLPLCVLVSNPDIHRLAAQPPADSRAAYEKVLAQRLLDERRAIIERIERQGALVLDVPAEQLTSGVINRYLEVKGTTRL